MNNDNLKSDYSNIINNQLIKWKSIHSKTIIVTGGTGLIGSSLIRVLMAYNKAVNAGIKIVALVRSWEKVRTLYSMDEQKMVSFIEGTLEDFPSTDIHFDYIVHCANPTSSKFFVDHPVETIQTAIYGTDTLLRIARENKVENFLFLSTMEVLGFPERGHKAKENEGGSFDTARVRNCYPLSKQLCENLCISYAKEYDVKTSVLRLTQTIGPGIRYDDGRVFAEFSRCAIENKTIHLKTKGETERCYLYVDDAVEGILFVLLNGKQGEIYTAANEDTYCSIAEMAQMVADYYGLNVQIDEYDTADYGYADTLYMDLDTSKLRNLGWQAHTDLMTMYQNLIAYLKTIRKID